MVLNAADLTIQSVNTGYNELLGSRNVIGLPLSEVFTGKQLDMLVKLLRSATKAGQAISSDPMKANAGGMEENSTFVHTVVPIFDVTNGNVDRLFIYSEKMEQARR